MTDDLRAAGWQFDAAEAYFGELGGFWYKEHQGRTEYGFVPQPWHANRNGVVHGGMMMTFVDHIFGMAARQRAGAVRAATISLSHQFLQPLQVGAFASLVPQFQKQTARMVFVDGLLISDGVPVLQAHGVWRISTTAAG